MTCEAASGILGNFEILQAGINANYNIARVLAVSTSFRVDEINSLYVHGRAYIR